MLYVFLYVWNLIFQFFILNNLFFEFLILLIFFVKFEFIRILIFVICLPSIILFQNVILKKLTKNLTSDFDN